MVLLIKLYLQASLSFTLESQTSVEETRQRRVEYFARYIIGVYVCVCVYVCLCVCVCVCVCVVCVCVCVHMYLFVHGFHNDNDMVFVICSKHCSMKLM